jgi:hypothetical protein
MAKTFTLKTEAQQTRYMYVTCEQVPNISTNTSTIKWTLTATGGYTNWYNTGPTTLTIGGQQVYYKVRPGLREEFPTAKGSVSGTLTIAHNENGAKEIEVVLSTAIYTSTISTYTGSWKLDDIPRGAKITSAPNFNDEENPTISYNNLAGNTVTTLQACITLANTNADIAYRNISKTGNTYTFNLTEAERQVLRNATLNGSANRKLYFKIKTVIGSNEFADMKEVTFSVINAEPTLEPTAVDTSTLTTELTGNPNSIIRGYNSVAVAANATARKGASIVSYNIRNGAKSITTASGKLDYVETNTFVFTVTDNRGLTVTENLTLPIVDYSKPTCNLNAKIELLNEENAKIILEISGNCYKGSFGATENSLAIKYAIKANNGDYGQWVTLSGTPTYSNGTYRITHEITGLVYTNSYTVKAAAYDLIGGRETSGITLQTIPVFDWSAQDFNFNVPVSIGGVELDYIVEQGTANGWTYRKWNSGIGECWKGVTLTTAATTQWGGLYKGTFTARQNYPFVFMQRPIENVSLQCANYGAFVLPADNNDGLNGTYASAMYTIARPASTTSGTYYLSYYVIGKWKN